MSSPDPRSDLGTGQSFVDWDELSGLGKVVAIHQAGTNILRVEMAFVVACEEEEGHADS